MVNSILNPKINFPELKKLDPDDKQFDASMYEVNILGEDVIIALGQAKYTFIDDNIIYYPIYLVKNDKVSTQIGVYEILAEQLPNVVDEDGDIDLTQVDEPLLYKFVNDKILFDNTSEKRKDTVSKDGSDDGKDDVVVVDDMEAVEKEAVDKEADKEADKEFVDLDLPEQTQNIMEKELREYKKDIGQPWVQDFFKSNEYQIMDNEGGGDCLFAVIRDAFKTVDKDISVMELRRKVADEVTPELYESYKEKYKMFMTGIQTGETELKELNKLNNELRDRLRNSKDRSEQQLIVERAKEVANKYKLLKSEIKISKELMTEFKFMKKVHSVEDLKKIMKTCEFWADTWAISTLERVLNIKLVIFSSESWKAGDKNNVLQCGQLNDVILEQQGSFEPEYYIFLDYTGDHYKLIMYKFHKIFSFFQIPYTIKLDVTKNCLQGTSGPYKIISQFKKFNEDLGVEEPIDLNVDVIKETENGLYDNSIVFQFYNKSNDKPLPGKGNGEKIPIESVKEFSRLAEINDWRRKLDNDSVAPFELDGHKWKTVEHYYQANKFKTTNPEFYLLFSLDSESKISNDVELAKSAGSKTGKHKGDLLRSKDIKIDPAFYGGNEELVLENGIYAKFNQDKTDLKQLLLQTKKAKLQHYKKGQEPELANALMLVRSKFVKSNQ
jgi:predicted NAD-dependent protein-ADP-ribosyltransferase YbiA (DUF1768 family)